MEFIKFLYHTKIRLMFYFGLGWNEFATPIAVTRDIAVILTFAKLVLNISFGWRIDALICLLSGLLFVLVGLLLKKSGMADYASRVSNGVNPQLMLIEKIYEMVRK